MSFYLIPNRAPFCPEEFSIQLMGNVHVNTSPMNGSTKTIVMVGDRWVFQLRYGRVMHSDLPELRAFWNRFKGAAHVLQIWNMAQPTPRGTMRGNPTNAVALSAGGSEMSITRSDGGTSLLPGDWIGITLSTGEVQTVEVNDSNMTNGLWVAFSPPLRRNVLVGATIYWSMPLVNCLLSTPPTIPHGQGAATGRGYSDGFSVDLVEYVL